MVTSLWCRVAALWRSAGTHGSNVVSGGTAVVVLLLVLLRHYSVVWLEASGGKSARCWRRAPMITC